MTQPARDDAGTSELAAIRRESRGLYWSSAIFSFFVNLLMLTGPLFMMQVYDRVLGSRSEATLVRDLAEPRASGDVRIHVLADPERSPNNAGLVWLADHLAERSYERAIVSGAPPFVYAVVDKLADARIEQPLESDVFSYAPRPDPQT